MQSHLAEPEKRHVYNDWRHWGDPGIWNPPADVDVARYQKRINQIVGVSASGQPIVRLKWAWEVREWTNCEWDSFGVATKGEWRARYRFMTVKQGEETTDLSVPRWVLEERFEPGQYEDSWNETRYAFDPELGCQKDVMGPPPREGWYKMLWNVGMICTHDPHGACCERVKELNRQHCWGYYKTPGEKELKMLARAVQKRDSNPMRTNPHEPFPKELVEALQASELERIEVEAFERRNNLVDVFASLNAPSMQGKQLYDMGSAYQRKENSGLYIPDTV